MSSRRAIAMKKRKYIEEKEKEDDVLSLKKTKTVEEKTESLQKELQQLITLRKVKPVVVLYDASVQAHLEQRMKNCHTLSTQEQLGMTEYVFYIYKLVRLKLLRYCVLNFANPPLEEHQRISLSSVVFAVRLFDLWCATQTNCLLGEDKLKRYVSASVAISTATYQEHEIVFERYDPLVKQKLMVTLGFHLYHDTFLSFYNYLLDHFLSLYGVDRKSIEATELPHLKAKKGTFYTFHYLCFACCVETKYHPLAVGAALCSLRLGDWLELYPGPMKHVTIEQVNAFMTFYVPKTLMQDAQACLHQLIDFLEKSETGKGLLAEIQSFF